MTVRDVMLGNPPEESILIQSRVKPDKYWPEIRTLYEGLIRDIPQEFWGQECDICWSMGHDCIALDLGYLG